MEYYAKFRVEEECIERALHHLKNSSSQYQSAQRIQKNDGYTVVAVLNFQQERSFYKWFNNSIRRFKNCIKSGAQIERDEYHSLIGN